MKEASYFAKPSPYEPAVKPQHTATHYSYTNSYATYAEPQYYTSNLTKSHHKNSYTLSNHDQSASTLLTRDMSSYHTNSYSTLRLGTEQSQPEYPIKEYTPNTGATQLNSLPSSQINNVFIPSMNFVDSDMSEFYDKTSYTPSHTTTTRKISLPAYPQTPNITHPRHLAFPDSPYVSGAKDSPFSRGKETFKGAPSSFHSALTREEISLMTPKPVFRPRTDSHPVKIDRTAIEGQRIERLSKRVKAVVPFESATERRKKALTDCYILERLTRFLDVNDLLRFRTLYSEFRKEDKYKKLFRKAMEKLAFKPMSKEDQYTFWNIFVDFKKVRQEHQFAFTQQFVRKCEYIRDISKDLDRTFPEYEKFTTTKGKDSLLKVLVALANTVKDVGYIQGLNSVAGVFLFYLREEESFWIMLFLLEKLKAKEIFKSDFNKVNLLNYQLEAFTSHYFPALLSHFNKQSMQLSYISTQWFITLFSYCLDLPTIIKLWNMIFIKGFSFLIQFGLALLWKHQDAILSINIDEITDYLKERLGKNNKNESQDYLFSKALEFKISKRLLNDLETFYNNGKPNLRLVSESNGKRKWEIVPEHPPQQQGPEDYLKKSASFGSYLKTSRPRQQSPINIPGTKTPRPTHRREKSPLFQNIVNTFTVEIPSTLKNIFTAKRSRDLDNSQNDSSVKLETQKSFRATEHVSQPSISLKTTTLQTEEDREQSFAKEKIVIPISSIVNYEELSAKKGLRRNSTNEDQLRPSSFKRGNTIELESLIEYGEPKTPGPILTRPKLDAPIVSMHSRKHSAGVMQIPVSNDGFTSLLNNSRNKPKETAPSAYGFNPKEKIYSDYRPMGSQQGVNLLGGKPTPEIQGHPVNFGMSKSWFDGRGYSQSTNVAPYIRKNS